MPSRVLVLGGGFAGLTAARELERLAGRSVEVELVDANNYSVFSPLLPDVAAGAVNANHAVVPLRQYLTDARTRQGEVTEVDLPRRRVGVRHSGLEPHEHELVYDQLVLALGSQTSFFGIDGLAEHAQTLDSVGDALALRNHVLDVLEQAELEEQDGRHQAELLTFVVGGGAFSGVEIAGALQDFSRRAARQYPGLREQPRVVVVEMKDRLLPELPAPLGEAALHELVARGVDVRLRSAFRSAGPRSAELTTGASIPTRTVVWAGGVEPVPLVGRLGVEVDERGRVVVGDTLRVEGQDRVWAIGDCAAVPDGLGGFQPPTAQHAVREGAHVARNVLRALDGRSPEPFRYESAGMLVSLGERRGVAEVKGRHITGLPAWLLWRGFYLSRLPTTGRKLRVALDWAISAIAGPTIVELPLYARVPPPTQRAVDTSPAEELVRRP